MLPLVKVCDLYLYIRALSCLLTIMSTKILCVYIRAYELDSRIEHFPQNNLAN